MALTPQNNDAFFREVDEEVRREQIGRFWKRWGIIVAVAVAVALIAFGGYLFWQHSRTQAAAKDGEALVAALETAERGNAAGARKKLAEVKESGRPGYRAATDLTLAALALQKNDIPAAVALYNKVAGDQSLAQPYRQLALLRATALEYDKLPAAKVIERLKPLAVSGNAWFGSAGELTAMAHLRNNRPDLAGPLFASIAQDRNVADSLRSRATQMAGALGVSVAQPKEGNN
ncbi:tetratricopeptide repeat protein [Sphingomonas sp. ID0503]|uniref:tetratricopeptide repeat protein n=1 Tax=Sphingomonas sp. ID0503 TaxID=3399691 RepID=UPI003AFABF38